MSFLEMFSANHALLKNNVLPLSLKVRLRSLSSAEKKGAP